MIPTKLYLAGPMTGRPQFNFPAFFAAADDLRSRGFTIVSPAEMDMEDFGTSAMTSKDGKLSKDGKTADGYTWGDFLSRDVKIVADQVEGVVCLPEWNESKGARLEVYVCLVCAKPVYAYTPDQPQGMVRIPEEAAAELVWHKPEHISQYKEVSGT